MTKARPVIFLHGWTMRGAIFSRLISSLPDDLFGIAPDLPGHGAAADRSLTLEVGAGLLAELLDNEALDDALLVGWSMGAAIAWTYLRDYGSTGLAGLVTVDMSPRMACGRDWPHGLIGQNAEGVAATTRRLKTGWESRAEAIASTMFADKTGPKEFPRGLALAQILSNDRNRMGAVWQALAKMDLRDTIGKIDIPYLACNGAKSRVYPASTATWLAETAPNAETHEFAHSGHSPHLEEPAEFARVISDFSRRL